MKDVLTVHDKSKMYEAIQSAPNQIVETLHSIDKRSLSSFLSNTHIRNIIITGMGGSGIAGSVFAATVRGTSSIPIFVNASHTIPAWVGPKDLVISVSCSGKTSETLKATADALHADAQVITIAKPTSPLADIHNAFHIPIHSHNRMPRACLWTLATPIFVVADILNIPNCDDEALTSLSKTLANVGKKNAFKNNTCDAMQIAKHIGANVPLLIASHDISKAVSYRFTCQIKENAKRGAIYSELPEANHNTVVMFDKNNLTETPIILLTANEQDTEPLIRAIRETAHAAGMSTWHKEFTHGSLLEKIGHAIHLCDLASVYLAVLNNVDPTPIKPIAYIKSKM